MQIPSGTFLRTPVPEDQLCGQRGPALETQCPLDLGHSSSVTAAGGSALSGRSCWACCLPLGPQSGWLLMVRGLGEGWHPHASSSVGSSCQAPFIGTQLALLCIQFSNADRRGQGAAGCLRRGGPLVAWEPPSRHPSPAHTPQLEETPETPPSSRAEGLLFLHGLESNPGSSLQTEEEAGLP